METPEEVVERLKSDAQKRLGQYQELRADIAAMAGTARSEDRSVTVTVAPGGAVTDIVLTEQAMRHGPKRLSHLLLTAMKQANADVAMRMAERVKDVAPPQIDVVGMVEARLPRLEDDEPGERKNP